MNYTGIAIGVITFLIIGAFHPLVIWAEYHFTKKYGLFSDARGSCLPFYLSLHLRTL